MDTAPDLGNPPKILTALEKEIVKNFCYAVGFGVLSCFFFLLTLSAWNVIFMASAVGWWEVTTIVTGVLALNHFVKVARGVKEGIALSWIQHKKSREGHSHAI